MADGHWLDDAGTQDRPEQGAPDQGPPNAIGTVAARLANVAPSWAAVTRQPQQAPLVDARVELLGRDRAQGFESIREGWLLHRGASRMVDGASPDLALLVGDWCYAAGLCTIADHGTLDDVAALSRLVADASVRAHEPVDVVAARWDETAEAMRHG